MPKKKKWVLERKTLEELEEARRKLIEHPLYDASHDTLSPEVLSKRMLDEMDYVVYAINVPAPEGMEDIEPGSIVPCDYDGKRAKWMNGTIYIKRGNLGKK
jgi:hypothetical protein